MSYISIGDMAQTFLIRHQNTQLKSTSTRLTLELTTGQTSDPSKRFAGDFTTLAGIEASLKSLQSYKSAANEAAGFANTMQTTLGHLQDQTVEAANHLLLTKNTASRAQIDSTAADIRQKFGAAVSALNTQIGGRSLFAGAATDKPAVASADVILTELQTAIAGETTAAGVESAVNNWFDTPGGGYDTAGYLGSGSALAPFAIGENQQADLAVSASDPTLRETLKGLALSALIAEGALQGDVAEQAQLMHASGTRLLSVSQQQTTMQANIGTVEAHIDTVTAQSASEISALEIARNQLLSVDNYETASELEAVQTQLETLYALTARVSRLSLVDFLR